MIPAGADKMPWWAWTFPLATWTVLVVALLVGVTSFLGVIAAAVLIATVFAAVFHAEVVAHKVGEPFGTLVLALAVTVIEVALIVSVMIAGGPDKAGLPRDTVFAAFMIICNGLIGGCLLAGGMQHREQSFQLQGAVSALAVLAALMTLSLVLPNVVTSQPGPFFTPAQLAFSGVSSLLLYASFIFVQTVRHRDYFLPDEPSDEDSHAAPPSSQLAVKCLVLLILSLVAVVGLAKALTPSLELGLDAIGAPKAVVGIVIAMLVLLPEGLSAIKAARLNRLQTSMNLALGSALAGIGLTVPAVAVVSRVIDRPIALGLDQKEVVLLALTLLVTTITLGTGRTTILQGIVHLVIFFAFLFFAFVP